MEKMVVALFDNLETAQTAVQQLLANGFGRDDISVVRTNQQADDPGAGTVEVAGPDASGTAVGAGIGAVLGGLAGLLVGLGALAIPGIGPVIVAGPLATTLAGAGLGAVTGGLVGVLAEAGIPERDAGAYAEGIRRGGTLVTVRTDEGHVSRATEILNRFAPVDINQRADERRAAGWMSGAGAAAPASTAAGTSQPTHGPEMPANSSTDYRASTGLTGENSGGTYEGTGSAGYTGAGTIYQGTGTFTSNTEPDATSQDAGGGTWGDEQGAMRSGHGEMRTSQGPVGQDAPVHPRPGEGDYQARRDFRSGLETEGAYRSDVSAVAGMIETGRGAYDSQGQSIESAREHATEGRLGAERPQRIQQPYKVAAPHRDMTEAAQDVRIFSQDARDSLEQTYERTMGDMSRGSEAYDRDFRSNWEQSYRATGYGYDRIQAAYQYGYNLATDVKYRGLNWGAIESDARRDWEARHPNDTWEDFKDAVRYAWDRVRGGVRDTQD